ncbi:2-phospho-L-lactate transferase [Saccharopolyspora rosea]|uniref:2-phospho-L-lactate transferase n=1 Tax=Saccharopolyspora rosea TaxID=524884 RepID=A0ABW3FNS7_9PSEU|nr:2-phospho-L-lactate transferase [Saccharopolyspora rosea]
MITLLGGGIGAARLWCGIARVTDEPLVFVVNTADDIWMHGLRVCPDLDTVLYALSGRQDVRRGWGVADESFRCMSELRSLGSPVWFQLGDRDLATHLFRTGMLRAGTSLSAVTRRLADGMGVPHEVLPMTDDEVTTFVRTGTGETLHYQEFLVRRGARDEVAAVHCRGVGDAAPADGVLRAIRESRLVVVGPSNPVASVGPVLALPGVRPALRATPARVVAVTPVVEGVPIDDEGEATRARSRAALLAACGRRHTAADVAALYQDFCDVFVVDQADAAAVAAIRRTGMRAVTARTLLPRRQDADALARQVLDVAAHADTCPSGHG